MKIQEKTKTTKVITIELSGEEAEDLSNFLEGILPLVRICKEAKIARDIRNELNKDKRYNRICENLRDRGVYDEAQLIRKK